MKVPRNIITDWLNFIAQKKMENSVISYISIKNALNIFLIPFTVVRIPKGTTLFRARINDNIDELFTKVQHLGHRITKNSILDFGRANEPLQSIFYCSTIATVARFETSRIHRQNIDRDHEASTIGIWELKKDIFVAILPSFNEFNERNEIVKKLDQNFEELTKEFNAADVTDWKMILKLFSLEFIKKETIDNSNYLITAAFSNYVYDNYCSSPGTENLILPDGIMYPSVQWDKEGMNIAIKSELVENCDIELKSAIYQKAERIAEKEYKDTITIKSKTIDYDSYEIQW